MEGSIRFCLREIARAEKAEYDKTYRQQGHDTGYDDAKDMKEKCRDDGAFNSDAYLEGWREGALAFYNEIQGQL